MRVKTSLLLALLSLIDLTVFANADSATAPRKQQWFVPDGLSAEFAGGFGLASAGILYGKKNAELGITVGYVPRAYGNIWTTNLLCSYTIIPVRLNKHAELHLLKAGAFVNFNHGKNIYLRWPEYYPRNYYWWNSSMRIGPFIDTELKLKPAKGDLSYTLFFQCLTNDLYLYTYFPNTRFIKLTDIIYFGAGIKIHAGRSSAIRH